MHGSSGEWARPPEARRLGPAGAQARAPAAPPAVLPQRDGTSCHPSWTPVTLLQDETCRLVSLLLPVEGIALVPSRPVPSGSTARTATAASQLVLTDVTKRYGDRIVLDRVSFSVRPGEKAGVVGDNGSGKSTLLRLLAGQERPDNGTVTVVAPGGVGHLARTPGPDRSRAAPTPRH